MHCYSKYTAHSTVKKYVNSADLRTRFMQYRRRMGYNRNREDHIRRENRNEANTTQSNPKENRENDNKDENTTVVKRKSKCQLAHSQASTERVQTETPKTKSVNRKSYARACEIIKHKAKERNREGVEEERKKRKERRKGRAGSGGIRNGVQAALR